MLAVFIEAISVGAEVVFGKSMAVTRLMKELKAGQITMLLGVPLLFNKLLAGIMKGIRAKGLIVYSAIRVMLAISYIVKKFFHINIGKKLFRPVLEQANIYSLRIAICGGGPLAASVFKVYNEMGIDFVQGYGLTETSPILTLNPIEHFKIQSVGSYFVGHMEMKILNPNKDGIGEIAVKGPIAMQGYYQIPEETAKMFTEDGFFKTGDLGWLDKENYLMLSGRVKNMIVTSGGKNVYPEEIEDMFQLETEISQITVQGYIAEGSDVSEELEALVYPDDSLFARLGVAREDKMSDNVVKAEVQEIVNKINRKLLPYQRITRLTILEKPLEMTTTLKVKRNYKK
jgi:long-chain acyl-CoA synthetase